MVNIYNNIKKCIKYFNKKLYYLNLFVYKMVVSIVPEGRANKKKFSFLEKYSMNIWIFLVCQVGNEVPHFLSAT